MVTSVEPTRQPPAGGSEATARPTDLLRELRGGRRDAFIRYHRMFRAPAYQLAWRLLGDEAAAAAATNQALVAAFRRVILNEGIDDLDAITYAHVLEACEARVASMPPAAPVTPRLRARGGSMAGRFEAALGALDLRQRAALLLHDLYGFDVARTAVVFGGGAASAATLVFRAHEEFLAAFRARDGDLRDARCRQAEEATAAAVGFGVAEDEMARLRHHAAYCGACRRVLRDWSAAAGLAVVLARPPLPAVLDEPPVFVVAAPAKLAPAVVATGLLARTGRALRGRATAWAAAAACLALAAGLAIYGSSIRPLVLMQSIGPAIRLVSGAPAAVDPSVSRSTAGQSTTAATSTVAIGLSRAPSTGLPSALTSPPGGQPGAASGGTTPSGADITASPDRDTGGAVSTSGDATSSVGNGDSPRQTGAVGRPRHSSSQGFAAAARREAHGQASGNSTSCSPHASGKSRGKNHAHGSKGGGKGKAGGRH